MMELRHISGVRVLTNGPARFFYIRDIGRVLGFGSHGGNLSRYVRSRWSTKLRHGRHYFVGAREAILLTLYGVQVLMELLGDPRWSWPSRNTEERRNRLYELLRTR